MKDDASCDSRSSSDVESSTAVGTNPTQSAGLSSTERRKKALFRFALSITVLTVVGHFLLGFEQAPIVPIVAVLVAYATALLLETVDAWARQCSPEYAGGPSNFMHFLLPPHIAALACSMLLYADNIRPYLLATVLAVASKYVIRLRYRGRLRHFMNPSNLGISFTLLFFHEVGFVPPYMFLNNTDQAVDVLIPLGILMAGTMLNAKLTWKMPLIFGWLIGWVAQAFLRSVAFDDVFLSSLGTMTGVAFVLYTNYMISDPGTTPIKAKNQFVFGVSTAFVYGALIVLQVAFAIFFALTIVCAIRGFLLLLSEIRDRASSNRTAGVDHSSSTSDSSNQTAAASLVG